MHFLNKFSLDNDRILVHIERVRNLYWDINWNIYVRNWDITANQIIKSCWSRRHLVIESAEQLQNRVCGIRPWLSSHESWVTVSHMCILQDIEEMKNIEEMLSRKNAIEEMKNKTGSNTGNIPVRQIKKQGKTNKDPSMSGYWIMLSSSQYLQGIIE